MPVAYVDIPAGVNDGAKKKIFQELRNCPRRLLAGAPPPQTRTSSRPSSRS